MSDIPAGWYEDEYVPGQEIWWDGTQWTEHTRPAPGAQQRAAPSAPPTSGPGAGTGVGQPPGTGNSKPWYTRWWVIALGVFVALVVVVSALGGGSDDDADDSGASAEPGVSVEAGDVVAGDSSAAAGASDEVDDVGACTVVDSDTVGLDVINNSSEQSSYIIDVNYLDDAAARIGDETFFVNYIRPGEQANDVSFAFGLDGAATCEVAEVERFSAQSPDDTAEVSCETAGVDALGDIATTLTATNGSDGLSDYLITAALVRDGVRIGTTDAVIENVQPGQAAPSDGLTTADGPADGVACEVVYVERTSSE